MIKLSSKIKNILSPYYEEFFGIDGPIALWLNDYIIKYGNNAPNNLFNFLESYINLVNNSTLCNTNIQHLFQYYHKKIHSTKYYYELKLISKNQIIYEVGRYYIGECATIKQPITNEITLGETTL